MFEIRVDDRDLKRLERTLAGIPKAMPRVMSRSMNRTATQARTQISRFLSKEAGIKVRDARQRTIIHKASYSHWHSAISISNKRLSLSLLKPRKTAKGYLSIKTGGKRITVRHAFFALKGWFIRQPEGGGYQGQVGVEEAQRISENKLVGRLPILRIKGPVLYELYSEASSAAARIQRESAQKLARNIHDQVELILRRRAG